MGGFLAAHGFDPGPTQRPLLAGAIAGFLASAPAVATLAAFGSLEVEARILQFSTTATIAAGLPVMAVAGAFYARLFGRAANDRSGGWLFGMAFGFALWAAGAVAVLPLVSGGLTPAGDAALGIFVSLILWGGVLGALLPYVHRPMYRDIDDASKGRGSGPTVGLRDDRRGG